LLLSAAVAEAGPGELDKSFDGDGFRTVDFSGNDGADSLLVQPDGKLVATGTGTVAAAQARSLWPDAGKASPA
jgi:hypothetical protein